MEWACPQVPCCSPQSSGLRIVTWLGLQALRSSAVRGALSRSGAACRMFFSGLGAPRPFQEGPKRPPGRSEMTRLPNDQSNMPKTAS
eukprot:6023328-Pyramimonas_sp.AAC.1